MIKSLYFMFFVCIALWGLIACGSSSKMISQSIP